MLRYLTVALERLCMLTKRALCIVSRDTKSINVLYKSLPNPAADFRILHLHADVHDNPIRGTLVEVNRKTNPRYLALSYTWGSRNNDQIITLNQQDVLVSANCASALRHIREEGDDVAIWVDAICINQADQQERNAQVGQMRDIYMSAAGVIVWLGDENAETPMAFDLLTEISNLGQYDSEKATSRTVGSSLAWAAVEDLFKRPYFERIWIIQEVSLAKKITIRCGSRTLSWTVFNRALQWYYEDNNHVKRSIVDSDSLFTNAVHLRNQWGMHNFDSGRAPPLEQLLASFSHWKATSPLDKVIALLGLSAEHADPEVKPDYTKTISQVYSDVVKHIVTRDRRLSILGQCQNPPVYKGLPSWVPDWMADAPYRWQISEIYRPKGDAQVMTTLDGFVLIPGSLRIPDAGYGTWQQESMIREEMNFDASLDMLAESHFPVTGGTEDEVFHCPFSPNPKPEETMMQKGVAVDTVHSVTRPLFRPREDIDDPIFFLEWERFAIYQTPPGIECPYGGTFRGRLDSFWRTISTDRIYLVRSYLRATDACFQLFEQWRAKLIRDANPNDAYVPDTADNIDVNDVGARSRAAYNALANPDISSLDATGAASSTPQHAAAASSETDLHQDYQRWLEHIAQIEVPTPTLTTLPTGLREELTMANYARTLGLFCYARKLARMTSGRLALVPEHTRPGDKVFVVYGASVPYILRELPNRYKVKDWTDELGVRREVGAEYQVFSPLHKFIGEAYVHGIMDGEALGYPQFERVSRMRIVEHEFLNPGNVPELEALRKTKAPKQVLDPLTEEQELLVDLWRRGLRERERDIWFDAITEEPLF